jgi:hypothetical protein
MWPRPITTLRKLRILYFEDWLVATKKVSENFPSAATGLRAIDTTQCAAHLWIRTNIALDDPGISPVKRARYFKQKLTHVSAKKRMAVNSMAFPCYNQHLAVQGGRES